MNRLYLLALILLGSSVAIAPTLSSTPAQSVQLSDGTVYFVSPPRLDPDSVYSSRRSTAEVGATYYFTLVIPDDAGEPLNQVSITQREGSNVRQRVEFKPDESFAFEGTRSDRGDELPLSSATFDEDSQTITLTFDPPVEPGTTVTVGVRPRRNPLSEGIYLFGITAYPPGEQVHGQFLGYGRLHFYRQGSIYFD